MRVLVPAVLALTLVAPARAQEPDLSRSNLPRSTVRHIERILSDSNTRHYRGDAAIAADETVTVPVVMRDGVLRIAGTLRSDLVVLQGDVVFEPGAVVGGSVTVVAGQVHGESNARIADGMTIYGEGFTLEGSSEPLRRRRDRRDPAWHWRGTGDADFTVHVTHNYNRVEGLPIRFGPDITTGGRYSTRLQALAIWRTDVGPLTRSREMGYVGRVEQFLGGETFRLGASVHSVIQPIESWSLTDTEASIAAAAFHDDQRDYFEREGWSVYARLTPPRAPLDIRIEYRDEKHGTVPVGDPWTLFNDDHQWRPQPRVGEGSVQLLNGSAVWDARRGEGFGIQGWMVRTEMTRAVDGTLRLARTDGFGTRDVAADFTTALIDLRRYQHAGHGGILAVRLVGGGALEERALPPQYQHALGGAGTMPGLPLFSADCGARSSVIASGGEVFFPAYGCDRFALAQVEYRGGFRLSFGHDHDDDDDDADDDDRGRRYMKHWTVDSDVNWTVFLDAGRGWALQQEVYRGRADTRSLYDVGAGIILGDVGIYGAVPLDDSERRLRLFVRLGPRF